MIYWFIFITLEIYRNYYLIIKKKTKPVYFQSFIIRGLAGIIHGSLIIQVESWKEAIPIILFQVTTFWIIFDVVLNLLRGRKWWYEGEHSGYLDHLPLWSNLSLKGILVIIYILLG